MDKFVILLGALEPLRYLERRSSKFKDLKPVRRSRKVRLTGVMAPFECLTTCKRPLRAHQGFGGDVQDGVNEYMLMSWRRKEAEHLMGV